MKTEWQGNSRYRSGGIAWAGLVVALFAVSACRPGELVRRTWLTMGTFATLSVPSTEADRIDRYAAEAQAICETLEKELSLFHPASDICRLNAAAGSHAVAVSADTVAVLRAARHFAEISGGAFDPTVVPLMRLWGFNKAATPESWPDATAVSNARARVGYASLTVREGMARLDVPGMSVDLGGIAKGYAVDRCYERLLALGARHFMINLGGNIRVHGSPRSGKPWVIGVRNPFQTDRIVGVLHLADGQAVATSGNYERFVTIGDRRVSHIVDPRTGYPVDHLASVTVVATNGLVSDGLSTTLFVLGEAASLRLRSARNSWEALFVSNGPPARLRMTSGFRQRFIAEPPWEGRIDVLPDGES